MELSDKEHNKMSLQNNIDLLIQEKEVLKNEKNKLILEIN